MKSNDQMERLTNAILKAAEELEIFNDSMPYFAKRLGKVEGIQEAKRLEASNQKAIFEDIARLANKDE